MENGPQIITGRFQYLFAKDIRMSSECSHWSKTWRSEAPNPDKWTFGALGLFVALPSKNPAP